MHKEVDFIAEYNEEMKELLAEPQTSPKRTGVAAVSAVHGIGQCPGIPIYQGKE